MLGGGFETGAITECFGQYGSAKTQIAHWLAVQVQKQDPTAIAVYIDTENTFRPERIIQFAQGAGLDSDQVLRVFRLLKKAIYKTTDFIKMIVHRYKFRACFHGLSCNPDVI